MSTHPISQAESKLKGSLRTGYTGQTVAAARQASAGVTLPQWGQQDKTQLLAQPLLIPCGNSQFQQDPVAPDSANFPKVPPSNFLAHKDPGGQMFDTLELFHHKYEAKTC